MPQDIVHADHAPNAESRQSVKQACWLPRFVAVLVTWRVRVWNPVPHDFSQPGQKARSLALDLDWVLVPPPQVFVHASQAGHPVTLQLTWQKLRWHSLQPCRTLQLMAPPRGLGALTSLMRLLEQFFTQLTGQGGVLQLCASLTEGGCFWLS